MLEENICKAYIGYLVSKIYKELSQLHMTWYKHSNLNSGFYQRELLMPSKHMKRSLPQFINKEEPIKTTLWLHYTPIRIVEGGKEKGKGKGRKGREREKKREDRRNKTDCNWKSDSLLMRKPNSTDTHTVWQFPIQLNTHLQYEPALSLLGIT